MKWKHVLTETGAKVLGRWLRWMVVHPVAALVLALLITVVTAWWTSMLSIKTNIEDLFPEDTPNVIRAQEAREKLSGSSQIILAVASDDPEANKKLVTELRDRLLEDELVDSVDLKKDISFFKKNALLFLDLDELEDLDARLKRTIKKAVAEDMSLDGGEDDGVAVDDEPYDDGFDDGFDDAEETADEGFDEGFDDGFGDEEKAPVAKEGTSDDNEEDFRIPTEKEIREKYNISSLSEYNASPDETVVAIKIYPSFSPGEVSQSQKLLDRIETTMAEMNPEECTPSVAFPWVDQMVRAVPVLSPKNAVCRQQIAWEMEGDYHSKIEAITVIKKDLSKASIFAVTLIVILVALYFGSLRGVILVMVPLLSGIFWTMGMAWLTIGYLNLITAFIFAILFGLGVDFAVHSANRYHEERQRGKSVEDSVVDGLMHLGRPMISAAITTTVTFISLVIFKFRGFSQFGLIAGLGVPLSLLAVYMYFAPLTVILNWIVKEKPPKPSRNRGLTTLFFGTRKKAIVVIVCTLLGAGALAVGIGKVDFESNMKKVMSQSKAKKQDSVMSRYRHEVESRSASPIVMLTKSLKQTREAHDLLAKIGPDMPLLQEFASIFSFVPDGQQARRDVVERMRVRLSKKKGALKGEERKNADEAMAYLSPEPFEVHDLPDWVKERFTDREGNLGHFVLLFAHGNKADAKVVKEITDAMGQFEVGGETLYTTASYYILLDAYNIVLVEGPLAVLLAALLVLLILILDFRSVREVLAAFLSLVVGLGAYLGYMGWEGLNINMFNMVVLPTLLGIGVDTSIHLLHRIREDGIDSISAIANTTGAAAGMSAITTAVGFGALSLATNPGLDSIGNLAPIGIILTFITSLLLTCSIATLTTKGNQNSDSQEDLEVTQ